VREEVRTTNNQHQMTAICEWWSSFVFLVFNVLRGMCCTPSGRMQEGREELLMGNRCDWGWY